MEFPSPSEGCVPGRIEFGDGVVARLASLVAGVGSRVFLVTGADPERHSRWVRLPGFPPVVGRMAVGGEPTVDGMVRAAGEAREAGADVVVAIGGGSVVDAGKAIAAFARNPGDPLEYLEVIGKGRALESAPLPVVAVPTTAGTGAEATRNAVLASPEHRVKVSLRSPLMVPVVAVVDPMLTHGLPRPVTAASGLDALTQLLEAFVCRRATPMTDRLCRQGLAWVGDAFRRVLADGSDAEARRRMAWCSLASGIALANAGLGVIHGFAGPMGGMTSIAHGVICAALLPHGTAANLAALVARDALNPALERYAEAGRLLTGDPNMDAGALPAWLARFVEEAGIPLLGTRGLQESMTPELVAAARRSSSLKANPVELTEIELSGVLEAERRGRWG